MATTPGQYELALMFSVPLLEHRAVVADYRGNGCTTTRFPCSRRTTAVGGCPSGPEQHLDGAAFVHGAVALGDLRHGQFQVEHLAGVDLPVPYEVDQLGQVAAHRGGTAVEVNVGEDQSLAVKLDPMRNADIGDVPALASAADRLQHRFLRPNALKHRVSTNSIGHVHDPGDALVAALNHDVGRVECAGELLPRSVPAHRDDALCTPLPGGEHAEEADRPVTDDHDRRAWLHIRRVGCEPAGPQNIGSRQQARDHIV